MTCENCGNNSPGGTGTINKPPVANAGSDQTITLPTDSVLLDGSASSDPDGNINAWAWRKISGPALVTIINSTASRTIVKNLAAGIYKFELKVKDNGGLSALDSIQIIVDDPNINQPPVANAGPDQTITLPTNTINLDGNSSIDPDNNITSYTWVKISGPSSYNIVTGNATQTLVTNLEQGVYQFELKVTDAGSLFSKDTIQILVDDPNINQPPVAHAGADQTINLPTNSIILNASGSIDPDNNITSFTWTKISGPSSFNIENSNAAITQVTNLVTGVYQFELKVTDAGLLFSRDTVQITVVNHPPVANAGADITVFLPMNSVNLNGSGSTDPENNITNYEWTKITGPSSFNIVNPNAVQTLATDLMQGVYQFTLKVTDAGNLSDTDTVIVTVLPAPANPGWTQLSNCPVFGAFMIGIDLENMFAGVGPPSRTFLKYNYQTNSWIQKANFPGLADNQHVTFAVGGKGYAGMGGSVNNGLRNEMYQYNPVTDQWIQKNNSPLSGDAISLVINNVVYLAKGQILWMYDPVTDSYIQKNNLPFSNIGNASFVINGSGYLMEGVNRLWKYNAATDTWQQKVTIPANVWAYAGFTLNNYGYVLANFNDYPLQLWRYDPGQDQWQRIYNDYPGYGIFDIKTVSLNGLVYVGFGENTWNNFTAEFFRFH